MSVFVDMFTRWLGSFVDWPFLSSLIGTVTSVGFALLASVAVYRFLQSLAKRLSPGPVFMFGAITVALALWARTAARRSDGEETGR